MRNYVLNSMGLGIITTLMFFSVNLNAQSIAINEFLAGNASVNSDQDGDYSDWIELYNAGAAAVDLTGFTITDDPADPGQWTFPSVILQPGDFLLVWASGKDLTGSELHTNFKLGKGGEFIGLYTAGGAAVDEYTFGAQTDDISMARFPDGVGTFAFTTTPTPAAPNEITAPPEEVPEIAVNEFLASNNNTNFDEDGDSSDWIELYNTGTQSINLNGFTITDDASLPGQWIFPAINLNPGQFLLVWASGKDRTSGELHTNFKLSSAGEYVGLYTPEGILIDGLDFGVQTTDVAMARIPDGSGDFEATSTPTPASSNKSGSPAGEALSFSPASGFFNSSVEVTLSSDVSGADIRYTLDGSAVKSSSQKYTGPINISSTKVIRARAFENGSAVSEDISHIYLIEYQGNLPVLSLSTDESNLYGSRGIFNNPKERGKRWERPVSVNLLELDGSAFQINAGVRVHGQHSRTYPKKSVRLYFRSEYGEGRLKYKLFEQKDLNSFDQLVIHSGGSFDQYYTNDRWTLLRDPLNHTLWAEKDGIVSTSRPVIVYINGDLWGIYHIRERINDDYLLDNFGIADADLLEWSHNETPQIKAGDLDKWNETYSFFENNSMKRNSNYRRAQELIDIDNFIDYNIIEIYGGHKDWPHNNNFFFRERVSGAKWRWILWDSESTYRNPKLKILEWATRDRVRTDISRSDSENQLFATLLLRRLIENDEFKELFINRFADFLNTTLKSDHVLTEFDKMAAVIESDVSLEANRWSVPTSQWHNGIEQVHDFISDRTRIQRHQIVSFFGLGGTAELNLKVNNQTGGKVRVNSLTLSQLPWSGTYFIDNPVTLEAIANPGFTFVGWSEASLPDDEIVTLNLSGDKTIAARFESSGPFIQVITPNGGEEFIIGQTYQIAWTSEQIGLNVRIEYSTNNGSSWNTIVDNTPNDGTHNWQVPNTPSTQCLVQISEAGFGNPSDVSDANFTIREAGGTPVPPTISSFNPTSGTVGIEVTINGANFSDVSDVQFNATSASSFSIESDSEIRAEVPAGATTGKINVVSPAGTGVSASNFTLTSGGNTESFTFQPTDDSFIWSREPNGTSGTSSDLRVRKTKRAEQLAYFKFSVSGVNGDVISARLRLFTTDGSDDGGSVHTVSNNFENSSNPWNEQALNWENAPKVNNGALSTVSAVSESTTVEFDVTGEVNGNGVYSFAVKNNSSDVAKYNSKESEHAPELVITTNAGPSAAPKINSFTPTSGEVGTMVTITGLNFIGAAAVSFGGVDASTFSVESDTQIIAQAPTAVQTGKIRVTTPEGIAVSAEDFTVTSAPPSAPVISGFAPLSGMIGTQVTISGSNFAGSTDVQFNGVAATTFSVESDSEILAIVPDGATTGKIDVTNADGTGTSTDNFVVTTGGGLQTLTFNPTDDAFVWSKKPAKNYGASLELRVRRSNSAKQIAYFKFNVTGVTGSVTHAALRLLATDGSDDGGAVYLVADSYQNSGEPWKESGLNWTNAPDINTVSLSSSGAVNAGSIVEFDVTQAIAGNGEIALAIRNTSGDALKLSSKEGITLPELVVDFSGAAVLASNSASFNEKEKEGQLAGRPEVLDSVPAEFALSKNYPNPFNPDTRLNLSLPEEGTVTAVIYNMRGQEVKVLQDGFLSAADHVLFWDGKDRTGAIVSSGAYLLRLEYTSQANVREVALRRLIMMK